MVPLHQVAASKRGAIFDEQNEHLQLPSRTSDESGVGVRVGVGTYLPINLLFECSLDHLLR
jgi:hypothetical protein